MVYSVFMCLKITNIYQGLYRIRIGYIGERLRAVGGAPINIVSLPFIPLVLTVIREIY